MKRKAIMKVAPVQPKKKGERITCSIMEDTLILDCYRDKVYLGRHGITRTGEHETLAAGGDENWKKQRLPKLFKSDYDYYYCCYSLNAEFDNKNQEQTAREFFRIERNQWDDMLNYIQDLESEYDEGQKIHRLELKENRFEALLARVPALPDGFEAWADREIFQNIEYMVKQESEGVYRCTACGKLHEVGKKKHNQKVTCPDTGIKAIVKNRRVRMQKNTHCMVLQKMSETESVARHFKLTKDYKYEKSRISACEEIRIIFPKGENKQNENVKIFYGQYYDRDEQNQRWWDKNPLNRHCVPGYCYPEGINQALDGTIYDRCAIREMAQKGWLMNYNRIMLMRLEIMEYFVKAGLKKLMRDLVERYNYAYGNWINLHGKTAGEVLGISMQNFHRLRQRDGGKNCLLWLQWSEQEKKKIPEEFLDWSEKHKIEPGDVEFILKRMSPVQIAHYLEKQKLVANSTLTHILEIWKDYLSMAERLGLDTEDEIVYRDRDVNKRHDELVTRMRQLEINEEEAGMRIEFPHVEEYLRKIRERYQYRDDQYLLVVPQTIGEIMDDGRQLHHCGGSSKIYYERMEEKETYIMFLRRTEDPQKAFYTLEVEPGGVIRQKRSEYNRQPDAEEIRKFLRKWQKELKKRMNRQDLEAAEKSRKKRLEEMEKLKTGTDREQQLHGLLVTDLMEIAG